MLIHLLNLFRCGAVIVSCRGARGAVFRDACGQRTARGARGVCGAVFRDTVKLHTLVTLDLSSSRI